jgi:DNA uptake protein ComE-like DNA-binding protein
MRHVLKGLGIGALALLLAASAAQAQTAKHHTGTAKSPDRRTPGSATLLDLNSATKDQLAALPGSAMPMLTRSSAAGRTRRRPT